MLSKVCLLVLFVALTEASVKVLRSSGDGRHPSSMHLEVQLPQSSKKAQIRLTRNDKFEDVPMTVMFHGTQRTFSSRQVHHPSHAHYNDITSRSVVSVRDVNGQKQFQGHFMHQGQSYLLEPNKEGHQVKRALVSPDQLKKNLMEEKKAAVERAVSRKRRQVGGSATEYVIEIGVCIDYKAYKKFVDQFNTSALTELHMYYTHIMTGVDVTYRNIGTPSISIKVVSLHVDSTPNDFTCMPASGTTNRLVGNTILSFLSSKKAALGSSAPDHLMAFTGEDIVDSSGSSSVCGMAYTSGTCGDYGVSINEDKGLHSWGTAAHELAHNMGSPHDGNGNACDPNEYYLMSPVGGIYEQSNVANSYRFSDCTVSKIQAFIASLTSGGCLKTSVGTQVSELTSSVTEGSRLTLDQVCKMTYTTISTKFYLTSDARSTPALICAQIMCANENGGGSATSGLRAPAGTACGSKKSCNWNGECTSDENAPEVDESCFWGDNFSQDYCITLVGYVKDSYYASYCSYVKSECCKTINDPAYNSGVVCT